MEAMAHLFTAKKFMQGHPQLKDDMSANQAVQCFRTALNLWVLSEPEAGAGLLDMVQFLAETMGDKIGKPTSPKSGGGADVLSNMKATTIPVESNPLATPKSTGDSTTLSIKTPENHNLNSSRKNIDQWVKDVLSFSPKDEKEHQAAKNATKKRLESMAKE